VQLCKEYIEWCKTEQRSFLRQRLEAKLALLLYEQGVQNESLAVIEGLVKEVKKLDEK